MSLTDLMVWGVILAGCAGITMTVLWFT